MTVSAHTLQLFAVTMNGATIVVLGFVASQLPRLVRQLVRAELVKMTFTLDVPLVAYRPNLDDGAETAPKPEAVH